MRTGGFALVTLALATAMHIDWHAARPSEHHLSLGWSWHWLLAVPVFALTAWYIQRTRPMNRLSASVGIILVASVLAAVVEPAWEYWIDGASWDWAFGRLRLTAFALFLVVGVVTQIATLALVSGRRASST
jgi:hypothetical protein